jgi:hypothetical protein
VKANLARFTWVLALFALVAGPIANGMRWGAS